jgi:pSer/pThr/pTyr-binding forkhead associated (FHA) protein
VDTAAAATTSGDGEVEGTAPDLADPSQTEGGRAPTADSQVVLRGHYADGRSLEVSARVSADAINLEIGRGGADLAIDSLAVSRRHARLNGTRAALTITDLGSSNGTSIDGIPCLEDEIMYLEPGSAVILGDVRFTVSVEPESNRP